MNLSKFVVTFLLFEWTEIKNYNQNINFCILLVFPLALSILVSSLSLGIVCSLLNQGYDMNVSEARLSTA